ncbi:MAG TPA: CBS domain-containing protein [Candidatus Moranbacteria bacterium]|nr:CBS domain-containing protein [Candidatus Moranbacteria bacterium]
MKVKDLMVKNVVYVGPEDMIANIAGILFENRFHAVPVVERGKVIGIITENDFFTKNSSNLYLPSYINFLKEAKTIESLPEEKKKQMKELINIRAKDIMTEDCLCVSPEEDIEDLLKTIQRTEFYSFPVAYDDKKIVGIITLMDVIGLIKNGIKYENYPEKNGDLREVDNLASEIHSWWGRFFVFINKSQIKTWKGALFLAAIAGAAAVFIWNVFW